MSNNRTKMMVNKNDAADADGGAGGADAGVPPVLMQGGAARGTTTT